GQSFVGTNVKLWLRWLLLQGIEDASSIGALFSRTKRRIVRFSGGRPIDNKLRKSPSWVNLVWWSKTQTRSLMIVNP
ncbi:hypothetical protein LINGRAHAP2_LOCUS4308, partial [Linum grandiflorum]